MTRAEAKAHCMTMDTRYGLPSHLASVQNGDENGQVLELCQASSAGLGCWLGYSSSSSADNASAPWAWDDQTEVGYENWDGGMDYFSDMPWSEPLQLSLDGSTTVGAIMQVVTAGSVTGYRTKGYWAATDPSLRRPFVCLEKYVEPPSPPPPPVSPSPLLPPLPPSPPHSPGARTIIGLSLEMKVSGDVASFDSQAFKESLALDLGVDASTVILTLRPGSVVVFAAIPDTAWVGGFPNISPTVIAGFGNAAASAAGADVEEKAEVTIGAVTLDAPPPSPPPSPPSPPPSGGLLDDLGGSAITTDSGGLEDWAIGLIAVGVVLALVVVITGLYCVCKKTKQSVTLSSPMPVTMMVGRDSDDPKSASATADIEAVDLESKM